MSANKAIVLLIGSRFFHDYKNNRVQTAWSLAGAKLFGLWDTKNLMKIEQILIDKGYQPQAIMLILPVEIVPIMAKPVRLDSLEIGDQYKYRDEDVGVFTVITKNQPPWVGIQRMSGRKDEDFGDKMVYPVKRIPGKNR